MENITKRNIQLTYPDGISRIIEVTGFEMVSLNEKTYNIISYFYSDSPCYTLVEKSKGIWYANFSRKDNLNMDEVRNLGYHSLCELPDNLLAKELKEETNNIYCEMDLFMIYPQNMNVEVFNIDNTIYEADGITIKDDKVFCNFKRFENSFMLRNDIYNHMLNIDISNDALFENFDICLNLDKSNGIVKPGKYLYHIHIFPCNNKEKYKEALNIFNNNLSISTANISYDLKTMADYIINFKDAFNDKLDITIGNRDFLKLEQKYYDEYDDDNYEDINFLDNKFKWEESVNRNVIEKDLYVVFENSNSYLTLENKSSTGVDHLFNKCDVSEDIKLRIRKLGKFNNKSILERVFFDTQRKIKYKVYYIKCTDVVKYNKINYNTVYISDSEYNQVYALYRALAGKYSMYIGSEYFNKI